ncbi:MAG: hypothetical protein ACWA44_02775 [Thiotrichales bacterium]
MELISKAYVCFDRKDAWELDMPWVEKQFVDVDIPADASKAKAQAWREWGIVFDCSFLNFRVRRIKSSDLYLFEGRKRTKAMIEYTLEHRKWVREMEEMVSENAGKSVYIYSGQWGAYWRPNSCGYTTDTSQAGVYEISEAWQNVSHCGLEKKISFHFT